MAVSEGLSELRPRVTAPLFAVLLCISGHWKGLLSATGMELAI